MRSGEFKGDEGPANVLSIGTVSTLPPGAEATAAIVGESPSQVLNLGLVEGPEGKASTVPGPPGAVPTAADYLIVGPGRPDVPSTTAGTITGAEPVGARYESVDEAGVGARTWRKVAGNKWVVTSGDTGLRRLDHLNSAITNAGIWVRRVGDVVHWEFNNLGGPAAICRVPAGFQVSSQPWVRPGAPVYRHGNTTNLFVYFGGDGGPSSAWPVTVWLQGTGTMDIAAAATYTHATPAVWPSTLPGSPA